jgi:hypothetical protein
MSEDPADFTEEGIRLLFRRGYRAESSDFVRPPDAAILRYSLGRASAEETAEIEQAMALSSMFRREILNTMNLLSDLKTSSAEERPSIRVPLDEMEARYRHMERKTSHRPAGRIFVPESPWVRLRRFLGTPFAGYAVAVLALLALGIYRTAPTLSPGRNPIAQREWVEPTMRRGEDSSIRMDPDTEVLELAVRHELNPDAGFIYGITARDPKGSIVYQSRDHTDFVRRNGKFYPLLRVQTGRLAAGTYEVAIDIALDGRHVRTDRTLFTVEHSP